MLYIVYEDVYSSGYEGVKKKIESQCEVFSKAIEKVCLVWKSHGMAYISNRNKLLDKKPAVSSGQYLEAIISWIINYDEHSIYIRNPLVCDVFFIELLHSLDNKDVKTIIEIPTYPYDGEMRDDLAIIEDSIYRCKLANYSCYVATSSTKRSIWGLPVIRISNGIDVNRIHISRKSVVKNEIVLVAVASSFIWWQGFERLLEGIGNYKKRTSKKYKIKLMLVGSGGDENKYRSLVDQYNITEEVFFCGRISVEKIDNVLEEADIAVSCLAIHRKKMEEVEPIKVGEYCAKGLPIICAYKDPRFPEEYPYLHRFSADETAINIDDLISFWEEIIKDAEYKKKIRKFAEEKLSWENTMRNVVAFYSK